MLSRAIKKCRKLICYGRTECPVTMLAEWIIKNMHEKKSRSTIVFISLFNEKDRLSAVYNHVVLLFVIFIENSY